MIATEDWGISSSMDDDSSLAPFLNVSTYLVVYVYCLDILQNSIVIMEDVSQDSKMKFKEHIQQVVNEFYTKQKEKPVKAENPWFEEFWRHKSNCLDNQTLDGKECGITNIDDNFYVDSWVTDVMDVAVIFHHTIMKYNEEKCNNQTSEDCIHEIFDGKDYFENFIMKKAKDLPHLFGDGQSKINLNSCGDSTPKYAIYQFQASTFSYEVRQKYILL